jgi:hypothetical protein
MSVSFEIGKRGGRIAPALPVIAGRLLAMAAAPSFALMAMLSAYGSAGDMICSTQGSSMLGGMVPMYLLMSVFHAAPWLKLVADRPGSPERSR